VLKKHGYKRFSEDAEKALIELQGTSPPSPGFRRLLDTTRTRMRKRVVAVEFL